MVNLYNVNTEKDQLTTTDELSEMLKNVNNISAKQIILGGILIFTLTLYQKAKMETLYLKKKSSAKMIKLKNTFELCNTWTGFI